MGLLGWSVLQDVTGVALGTVIIAASGTEGRSLPVAIALLVAFGVLAVVAAQILPWVSRRIGRPNATRMVLEADVIVHVRDAAHDESAAQKADVLKVLAEKGLLKGKTLGIDATTMEASAATPAPSRLARRSIRARTATPFGP